MKAPITFLNTPVTYLLLIAFLILLPFNSSAELVPRGEVQDAIPTACAGTCSVIATALETCGYGDCLCTNPNAQGLEDCMDCLYGMSSVSSVYDAVQDALSAFDNTCSAFIDDIALTIPGPGKQMCMVVSRQSQSPIRMRSSGALSSPALPLRGSYPHALYARIELFQSIIAATMVALSSLFLHLSGLME